MNGFKSETDRVKSAHQSLSSVCCCCSNVGLA